MQVMRLGIGYQDIIIEGSAAVQIADGIHGGLLWMGKNQWYTSETVQKATRGVNKWHPTQVSWLKV